MEILARFSYRWLQVLTELLCTLQDKNLQPLGRLQEVCDFRKKTHLHAATHLSLEFPHRFWGVHSPWSYLFITFAIFQIIRHPYSFICSNVCLVESVTSCCFRKYWDDFRSHPISFPPEWFYSLYSWGLVYCIKWIGHCLEKSGGEGIRVPSWGNLFFNALQRNRCGESWEQAWQEGRHRGGEKSNPSSNVKGSSS